MRCDEFLGMMDAFVDGELGEEARQGILQHARVCDSCAKELKLNGKLREALCGIDADVTVPLAAQASWRAAVKAEARRRRMKGIYRAVGAVAAAFAVLIGVAAGLDFFDDKPTGEPSGTPTEKQQTMLAVDDGAEISGFTFVEPDGNDAVDTAQPVAYSAQTDDVNASVKLVSGDIEQAVETVKSLVAEFGGDVRASSVSESSAYITVYDIPSGELTAFIDLLENAGTVESSRMNDAGGDMASVTITIKGE